ncbi:hypothetical protein AAMO2058_000639600 [Amorphochlora amoebiformis]
MQGRQRALKAAPLITHLSLLHRQVIRDDLPELAHRCGWDVDDEDVKDKLDEEVCCFHVRGAPVSNHQERTILCRDVLPAICIGRRRSYKFKRISSEGSGYLLDGSIAGSKMMGLQEHKKHLLEDNISPTNNDYRFRAAKSGNENIGGPLAKNDFINYPPDIGEDLYKDVTIRVLHDGYRETAWKGKQVRDFVSLLGTGRVMTPSPSVSNMHDLQLKSTNANITKVDSQTPPTFSTTTAQATSRRGPLDDIKSEKLTLSSHGGSVLNPGGNPSSHGSLSINAKFTDSIPKSTKGDTKETTPQATSEINSEDNQPLKEPIPEEKVKSTFAGDFGYQGVGTQFYSSGGPPPSLGDLVLDGKAILEKLRFRKGAWIDIVVRKDSEVIWLSRALGLHPLTIEDILEVSREKMEVLKPYTFLLITTLKTKKEEEDDEEQNSDFAPLRMLIYKDLLITIHPWGGLFERIRKALPQLRRERKSAIAKIAYFILDSEIEAFVPHVESLMGEVDVVENLVYVLSFSERADLLRRMAICRRRIAQINQIIWSKAMVFQSLKSQRYHMEAAEDMPVVYLQDILDSLTFMTTRLKLAREFLDGAQATYLARVSVEAADHSSEIEERMNTLSSVATIFVPLTTITGMWGMNVVVPGQVFKLDVW